MTAPPWFHRPNIFLEVDTERDFEMMSRLIDHFLKNGDEHFGLAQILDYLDHEPELAALNRDVPRRWWSLKEPAPRSSNG